MKVIEYKSGEEFFEYVLDNYKPGEMKVICPGCKEEMLIILNDEDVKIHQRSHGIYCPKDHIQVVFNVKG